MAKIYSEHKMLLTSPGVRIEVGEYYTDKSHPDILFAKGLGGAAGRDFLVDKLANHFRVTTFSPRNSGNSEGSLTIDNYLRDVDVLSIDLSNRRGEEPYNLGHSLGGYAFGKLLEGQTDSQRTVLLAPLIDITEQNPGRINPYLKSCIEKGRNPLPSKILQAFTDKQRFAEADVLPFFKSFYNAAKINGPLPETYVVLPEGTSFRASEDLHKKRIEWQNLGAEVDIVNGMNHWFSGPTGWFSGPGNVFCKIEQQGILENIIKFLSRE